MKMTKVWKWICGCLVVLLLAGLCRCAADKQETTPEAEIPTESAVEATVFAESEVTNSIGSDATLEGNTSAEIADETTPAAELAEGQNKQSEPPRQQAQQTAPPETQPIGPVTEPTVPPQTEPPTTRPPQAEPPETQPPVTEPVETEPPATQPPAAQPTEPAPTEPASCTHDWQCVHHDEEGHWRAGIVCDCGWVIYGSPDEVSAAWNAHSASFPPEESLFEHGGYGSIDDWIVDVPAYEEWYCSLCGETKP